MKENKITKSSVILFCGLHEVVTGSVIRSVSVILLKLSPGVVDGRGCALSYFQPSDGDPWMWC